ncbi:WD40/YVTN/BNR-like repeat-containing protein [Dokdonella soli]|uniref:Sortilin N-terminal domain-containing protein n=1 Tax=Dokdonella soli TaxID=529810 RepID=A0ABN1IE96_9GAMM
MVLRRFVGALLALLSTQAIAQADPAQFKDLDWRLLGPFRGGRVLAVTGVPGQPAHFYFGAVNGGVWETQDAGRTWQPIFDGQPVGSIGALAVAPSDPNVLYVGTGEVDMRSDIAQGDGVYKSIDAGKTWTKVGLADSQQIGRILVDPRDANTVFVAALGHPYGPNVERGVFRSRDGGVTWQKVLGPDDATGAIDLAFEPGNPRVVYASLWQARRTPWNVYPPASGPGSGLYKSTDGGDSWQPVRGNGFAEGKIGRIGIDVAHSDPKRVYAIVDGDEGGLYRSDDAGAHWRKTSGDPRVWQRGWYFGRIAVDPKNADRIYAMNTIVLRSDDGGKTFLPLKGDDTGDDFHELWIDPQNPDRQILGVDQGAIVTINGGRTWSSWHNQPTAQIYHVATDSRFPYRVYGAQQDSGAVSLPSRTNSRDGISMQQFRETTAGGESGMIAPDPKDPDIVYGGSVQKLDLRTEQTRAVDPTLAEPDLHRRTWTLPLAFGKRNPGALYFGNQKIWRTTDGGTHWDPISPDLTREDPGAPSNLDAVTAANNLGHGPRRGVVYAIAPSPLADGLLWAGTDDGRIWLTHDEGSHWNDVTPAALTAWSKVGIIEASHFDADTAYAAVDRHRLDDRKPYVYRTRDGGKSWQLVVAGIRDGDFVNAVREDPKKRGLLYAGTELGVYVSFDDGDHWQPLQQNLPRTSVRDIDVHGDDLVIATHGRGFWVMDDVAMLRQLDAKTSEPQARLFAPSTAIRYREASFSGTPLPKDEPLAANPVSGARIDYWLARAPKKPVELAIYDERNTLVRRYSSADAPPKIDLAKINNAPEWSRQPSTLKATPGMHRFVWPLHYPAVSAKHDAYAEGVWAPPGHYTVELSVDGKRYRQALAVTADPRVDLPAAAHAEQFALARRVEALQARVEAAGEEAGTLRDRVVERRKEATGDAVAALDAFAARLAEVSGAKPAPNPYNAWSSPPRTVETLAFLDQALGELIGAVDGADAAPSPDAQAGCTKLAALTDATLRAWDDFKRSDLATLNATLKAAHVKSVELKPAG